MSLVFVGHSRAKTIIISFVVVSFWKLTCVYQIFRMVVMIFLRSCYVIKIRHYFKVIEYNTVRFNPLHRIFISFQRQYLYCLHFLFVLGGGCRPNKYDIALFVIIYHVSISCDTTRTAWNFRFFRLCSCVFSIGCRMTEIRLCGIGFYVFHVVKIVLHIYEKL